MKKDIDIPQVENVEIAIVKEYNEDFLSDAWYAYLFNNNDKPLEAILIVSQAKGMLDNQERESSLFRHAFALLAPNESLKIELLDENIFKLDNHFMLTYFLDGKLFDKNFVFKAGSIKDKNLKTVDFTDKKLILS